MRAAAPPALAAALRFREFFLQRVCDQSPGRSAPRRRPGTPGRVRCRQIHFRNAAPPEHRWWRQECAAERPARRVTEFPPVLLPRPLQADRKLAAESTWRGRCDRVCPLLLGPLLVRAALRR